MDRDTKIAFGVVGAVLLFGLVSKSPSPPLRPNLTSPVTTIRDSSLHRRNFADSLTAEARRIGEDEVTFEADGPNARHFVWYIPGIDSRELATLLMSGTAHDSGYVTRSQLLALGFDEFSYESKHGRWRFDLANPDLSHMPEKPPAMQTGNMLRGRIYMSAIAAIQIEFVSDTRFRMLSGFAGERMEGTYSVEGDLVILVAKEPWNRSYALRSQQNYLRIIKPDGSLSEEGHEIFKQTR